MELFVPSLLILVIGAIVCFAILPKASPYILGFLALGMFIVGAWQHYKMFPYEYRLSLFTEMLQDYAPFVMLIVVIFGGMVAMMLAFGVSPPAMSDVIPAAVTNALPAAITNIVPANAGKVDNVKKANNSGLMNMFNGSKPANNSSKAANSGLMNMFNAKPPSNNNSKKNNIASPSFKTL